MAENSSSTGASTILEAKIIMLSSKGLKQGRCGS